MILVALVGLFCVSSAQNVDCFAERDSGSQCAQNKQSRMFYFLPRLGTCQPFQYNGCGGNSNKFATAKECRDKCANAQKQKDATSNDEHLQMKAACNALYDTDHLTVARCSSSAISCPQGNVCTQGFCCPTPNYLCNINYDTGKFAVGGEKSDKYFWVPKYRTCMRFSFYGTLGNANNFPNYNSCMRTCSSQSNSTSTAN